MKNTIRKILLVVCVCVFLYSAFSLGKIFYDYYMIEKETAELVSKYVDTDTGVQEDKQDPLNRVIDFTELQKVNEDIIGWLYIPDTKIDEPIVKGENNDTYLYTDVYLKSNKAGSLFIDEINDQDFQDDNTIIYGHNMKNGSRFHDLRYFVEKDYFLEHRLIYIYLPDGSIQVYQGAASAVIEATSELYQKGIDYQEYMKKVKSVSSVYEDVSDEPVNMIMLSTCYTGTDNRYVLYGQFKENIKR